MKIIFILLLPLLLLSVSLTGAWGCGDKHCEVSVPSVYYSSMMVNKDPMNENNSVISFTFDLNLIRGTLDQYGLVFFDQVNSIDANGSYTSEIVNNRMNLSYYGVYYFNNWYASKDVIWNTLPSFMTGGTDYYYAQILDDDTPENFQTLYYLGLPFYISSCYIDCDYKGDVNSCKGDGLVTKIWNYQAEDYSYGIHKDFVNLQGNYYLDSQEYPVFSEIDNLPSLMAVPGRVRAAEHGICRSVGNVKVGCILSPNPSYRHMNASDRVWNYDEILSRFPSGSASTGSINDCFGVGFDVDKTFNPFNESAEAFSESLGIPDQQCEITSDGKRICYSGPAGIINLTNYEMKYNQIYLSLTRQRLSNDNILEIANRLSFQSKSLQVMDVIASLILLVYYMFLMLLVGFIIFMAFPSMLNKILDLFRELGRIKRY